MVLESQIAGRLVAITLQLFEWFAERCLRRGRGTGYCFRKFLMLVRRERDASYLGIRFLTARFGVNAMPAKIFVETLLFFVNFFVIQRMFIFRELGARRKAAAWLALVLLGGPDSFEDLRLPPTSHLFAQGDRSPEGSTRAMAFGTRSLPGFRRFC